VANVTGSNSVVTNNQQTSSGLPTNIPVAVQQNFNFNPANGTAADQVDLKYTKTLTLAATPTTLDLTALTDVFGNSINFARVRSITLKHKGTTDGQNVTVSGGAANPWTGIITGNLILFPSTANNNGVIVLWAPGTTGAVVSGASKTLKLDPGANTITVDIEICGASV
jgi:hypothetical protein